MACLLHSRKLVAYPRQTRTRCLHVHSTIPVGKMKIVLALVGCCAVIQATAETLVEHEYGTNHDQLDDGFPFVPRVQVPEDDPSFAQGYFLRDAAEGPDNARCLGYSPCITTAKARAVAPISGSFTSRAV